jgi:glycosyltransferase involved in cell wall biosynthesis
MVSMTKKNILIICPFASPNIGGVESHLDRLMEFLVKKNYYPILLTYQPLTVYTRGETLEKTENYEIHRIPWFGVGLFNKLENYFPLVFLYLFPGLYIYSLFYYLANHKNIYCIHAHGFIAGAITRMLTLSFAKRSVISTHAVYNLGHRKLLSALLRVLLSGFDKVLAVSEVSRNELLGIGLDKNKVGIHKNWVDQDKLHIINREKAKTNLGITSAKNYLFVGRLIEKKGIKLVIETAKNYPSAMFHVVGTGPLEEYVEVEVKNSVNIKYYGKLSQNDSEEFSTLLNLYNACDILISPYLYDEGFSLILLEALSCGTPLIVTKRGSPPTFLDESVCVYLSTEPTMKELVSVLNNKSKLASFSREKCKAFAQENFGEKNTEALIKNYD